MSENESDTKPLPLNNDVAAACARVGSAHLLRALADIDGAATPDGLRKFADDLERQELGAVEVWEEAMGEGVQSVLREQGLGGDEDASEAEQG